jgi:hypothetical protein
MLLKMSALGLMLLNAWGVKHKLMPSSHIASSTCRCRSHQEVSQLATAAAGFFLKVPSFHFFTHSLVSISAGWADPGDVSHRSGAGLPVSCQYQQASGMSARGRQESMQHLRLVYAFYA